MPNAAIHLHPAHYKSATAAAQPARTLTHATNFSFMTLDYDASTDEAANCHLPVPFSFVNASSYATRIGYRTAAIAGNVVMQVNTDADQNTTTVSLTSATVTDAALGTTNLLNTAAATPTSNLAVDRMCLLQVLRDADNASDTTTGDGQLLSSHTSVTSVTTLGTEEVLVPMGALALPSAGGCTLTTVYATTNVVDAVSFPNGGGYAEFLFTLPRYYTGSLRITTWVNPGDTGTTEWRHDIAYVATGEAFDPAYGTGSAFTITGGVNTSFYQDKQRAALAGAAAGDTVKLRIRRTANGTSTAAAKLLSIHIDYAVGVAMGKLPYSPQTLLIPTTNPATIVTKQDVNSCYHVARFAAGSATNLCGQSVFRGASYLGGGILRVRWISSGAGTFALKALYAFLNQEAQTASTNPSATDPGTQTVTNLGAGTLNETSFIVPPGAITQAHNLLVKLQRQSNDTIAANVEIVDAWWEFLPKI